MPKVPRHELGQYLEPESEEHTPSLHDIVYEESISQDIKRELANIGEEIGRMRVDPYTGEKEKFNATDPDALWEQLAYLRRVDLQKLKDPELSKNLEKKILQLERQVYKQFVPFIESRINIFGWQNSSLEHQASKLKINPEEILSEFKGARLALDRFEVSEEDRINFLSELDRLQEKFERYRGEPTLFTFEKIEEESQRIISSMYYLGQEKEDIELLIAKSQALKEIASRMLNEEIRTNCQARAKSLLYYAEDLKKEKETESPSDNDEKRFEAKIKDVDWAWSLLGIGRNASKEEVKRAYKNLAFRYHPDRNQQDTAEKMKSINEAFSFIKRVKAFK